MDSLTDSVARLHRAGSEHSQSTQKLRAAANALLKWIKENVPSDFSLPCDCRFYPSGEFVRGGLTNPPHGTSCEIFKICLGQEHSREQLFHFSRLIADGFIDQLAERLAQESAVFDEATRKVAKPSTSPSMPWPGIGC